MALLSLRMLLESPNPSDPQDAEVASMMMEDREYFDCVAHDWAVKYAGAPRTQPKPEELVRKVIEKQAEDPNRLVWEDEPVPLSSCCWVVDSPLKPSFLGGL